VSLPDRLLTTADVAAWVRMSREWVQEQIREGKLPARLCGREWRIDPEELEAWWRRER
jgi:excisionase family DNA binding protein